MHPITAFDKNQQLLKQKREVYKETRLVNDVTGNENIKLFILIRNLEE